MNTPLIFKKLLALAFGIGWLLIGLDAKEIAAAPNPSDTLISIADPNLVFSPYNWYKNGSVYAQTPNPGAYVKLGFIGTHLSVNVDVSTLTGASVPPANYPLLRWSIDNGAPQTFQLTASTTQIPCAAGLAKGRHTLLLQYVAGYVFLDFWTPVNAIRVTGFSVDRGARSVAPFGPISVQPKNILFLGDSITNGDNTVATFTDGITNAVATQDATVGYPQVVAKAFRAEFGIVAYGGASWDNTAADGHTPGLMTFYNALDSTHSRLVGGHFSPMPTDIFVNMGENSGPAAGDVLALLTHLRAEISARTNLYVLVPFSGRQRDTLTTGVTSYQAAYPADAHVFLIDLGNNPYLTDAGPTKFAVDGQHPLAALDTVLGAQIVKAVQQKQ